MKTWSPLECKHKHKIIKTFRSSCACAYFKYATSDDIHDTNKHNHITFPVHLSHQSHSCTRFLRFCLCLCTSEDQALILCLVVESHPLIVLIFLVFILCLCLSRNESEVYTNVWSNDCLTWGTVARSCCLPMLYMSR